MVIFINVWVCVDIVFNLDLYEVAIMTEKRFKSMKKYNIVYFLVLLMMFISFVLSYFYSYDITRNVLSEISIWCMFFISGLIIGKNLLDEDKI